MEEIGLDELKNYLIYADNVDVMIRDECPKGHAFLLRKAHLAREFGTGFGNDVIILSTEDFENEPDFLNG